MGHLARLEHSAAWFGFPYRREHIVAALDRCPSTGVWRVRLTLGRREYRRSLGFPGAGAVGERWLVWRRKLSTATIRCAAIKTSVRRAYERPGTDRRPAEVFDMIFLNRRGEVVEGRGQRIRPRDDLFLTPPVESGALPGCCVPSCSPSGRARESVLVPEDLARPFLLGNALRGLIWVRLVNGSSDEAARLEGRR